MPRFIKDTSAVLTELTQIAKLYNSPTNSRSSLYNYLNNNHATPRDYNYSSIITDDGFGRLTAGLKSLELLSILCSGDAVNLFFFDNIIYRGTPENVLQASDDQLVALVIDNLGMTTTIDALSDATTNSFKLVCLDIGREVKVGIFDRTPYNRYILYTGKALVKLFLQLKVNVK